MEGNPKSNQILLWPRSICPVSLFYYSHIQKAREMGGGAAVNVMSFEEGWHIIEKEAIAKLIQNLELGKPCLKLFTPQEYMRFYTYPLLLYFNFKVYSSCTCVCV